MGKQCGPCNLRRIYEIFEQKEAEKRRQAQAQKVEKSATAEKPRTVVSKPAVVHEEVRVVEKEPQITVETPQIAEEQMQTVEVKDEKIDIELEPKVFNDSSDNENVSVKKKRNKKKTK